MFYDLHVSWSAEDRELQRTVAFLDELGYDVVALTHTVSGKLPSDISCPIPETLPFPTPSSLRILRRCTLVMDDPSSNHRISQLNAAYDLLALRPIDDKTLKQACDNPDCDIISIDMTKRLGYYFKFKTLSQAIERGARFEICYAPSIVAKDSQARRNVISNATQLIRATRGRGIIITSAASSAIGCRAPWDVINVANVWGLGQEKGKEALTTEARNLVAFAQLKRRSFRGVVDVVYGGEKPAPAPKPSQVPKATKQQPKRKAEDDGEAPISNRERKRREKQAKFGEKQAEQAKQAEAAKGS